MAKYRENSWNGVGEEIWSRIHNAFVSIPFITSFILGVLVISSIGIWLPYSLDKTGKVLFFETQNLLTYSLAFIGTMVVDLLISNEKNKSLTSLSLLVGAFATFLLIYGYIKVPVGFSWCVFIGSIITLLMFIFFTVNDPKYDIKNKKENQSNASVDGYNEASEERIKDR